MEIYPSVFEAYECGEPVFKVESFDEHTVSVTISSVVTLESWKEIALEIEKCITQMGLEA